MKQQIVIYKAKPQHNAENERLLKGVFAELKEKQPRDIRYVAARLDENTYIHIVYAETSEGKPGSLVKLEAFRTYQADVRNRLEGPPMIGEATIIGNYHMLIE